MYLLNFILSITVISLLRFFAEKTEGAERTGCRTAIHQCTRARMMHQLQLRGQYHVTIIVKRLLFKKQQKQLSLHKKISKKKSSPCRDGSMHECMHWLTKYKNKTCHAHSDYALHNTATLFNNHPYISSSKFEASFHWTFPTSAKFLLEIFLWRLDCDYYNSATMTNSTPHSAIQYVSPDGTSN